MAEPSPVREHRAGFVALVGRPNAGKSTLLNRLSGARLAIVSSRPQTTRNRITAIRTTPEAQIVYVDTPGLRPPEGRLGAFMAQVTAQALADVDVVVLVCEAPAGQVDAVGLEALGGITAPAALALSKVDRVPDKRRLLPLLQEYASRHAFRALVPVSALDGTGIVELERVILGLLPPSPALYPPETITDQPETFFVAEVVREQVFRSTRQEVPYATAVRVEELVERADGRLYIRAVLFVEEVSQRAILIGARGLMLKRIGQAARRRLEDFFGVRVYLALWVEVRPGWRRDPKVLHELGYRLTS